MFQRAWSATRFPAALRGVAPLVTLLFLPACAARTAPPAARTQPAPAPVAAAPAAEPRRAVDPADTLLAISADAEALGRRELADGHAGEARVAFDRALDVLLTAPRDVRDLPRVADRTRQLIDGISSLELEALGRDAPTAEDGSPLDSLLAEPTFTPPAVATTTRVTEDLAVTRHDIEIPLNARVLGFVELYTGRLKGFLEESLSRGARYLPMIQQALAAEGLPTDLAFVPIVESAFKPNAMSRAKARGLWQFMRGTAVENGLRHDWYVDERAEPERATLAAARYLKTLHGMFGDWHLALASYNGGPGRVQRAIKRSGKTDFWALTTTSRFLPRETRDYVPLILAATIVGRNPEQYGLTVAPPETAVPAADTIAVTSPIDLRRLAEAIEHPVDELKALNPALRRWATPPNTDSYTLKIPAGTAAKATEFLASFDPEQDSPYRWHTTKKGDTVASVARKLKVTRRDLLDANFLKTRARLRPGQRLIVPKEPAGLAARLPRPDDEPVAAVANSATRPAAVPAAAVRTPASRRTAASAAGPVTHRVKRGETLGSIARRYRASVDDLRRWNRISGSAIRAGQRITVRPRSD